MRIALAAGVLLLVAGCGGGGNAPTPRAQHQVCRPTRAAGYTVCGYPLQARTASSIWRSFGRSAVRLTGPAERVKHDPHPAGFWVPERLFPSSDGQLLLAQWSGQCEAQSTYIVSATTGAARRVLGRADESSALGWTKGGWARIKVPRPVCGDTHLTAGLYAVDPATLRPRLIRRLRPEPGGP